MPVYFKKIFKWTGFLLLGLVLLLGLALVLLQTKPAKEKLTSTLEEVLSQEGMHFELKGLQGWLPIDFSLGKMVVSDEKGVFLQITKASFAWSPLNLLTGTIQINRIGAGEIDLQRLPLLPEKAAQEKAIPEQSGKPLSLPPILVKQIDLPRISLGADLTRTASVFALSGSLDMPSLAGLNADIRLNRVDRQGVSTRLTAHYAEPELTLAVRFTSPRQGLLQLFLDRELPGDIDLRFQGKGPVEDFAGELNLDIDTNQVLSISFNCLRKKNELSVKGAGTLLPAAYLPPPYSALFDQERPLPLSFDLDYDRSKRLLRLHGLKFSSSWADLNIQGTTDLQQQTLDQRIDLGIRQLSGMQPLCPLPLSGHADLEMRVSGPWTQPGATVQLKTGATRVGAFKARENSLSLALTPTSGLDTPMQSFDLQGRLKTEEFSSSGLGLRLPRAEISFDSSLSPEKDLTLEELVLTTGNEELALSALLRENGRFQARINGALQKMSDLPVDVSLPIRGGVRVSADLSGNWRNQEVSATVQTTLRDLGGLPDDLLLLTGTQPALELELGLINNQLSLDRGRLRGDHLDLQLSGGFGLKQNAVQLDWTLTGPSLEQFNFSKNLNCRGRIEGSGRIQGTFSNLRTSLQARITDFELPPLVPGRLSIQVTGQQLPVSPRGEFALELAVAHRQIVFTTDFLFKNKILQLNHIQARAPQTGLSGSLELNLQRSFFRTGLDLRAKDLSWLQTFIPGQKVSGGVNLELSGSGELDNPGITADLKAEDLKVAGLNAAALSANLRVVDLKKQQIDLQLIAGKLELGQVFLEQTTITGQGAENNYELALDVQGTALEPFSLQTRGNLRIDESTQGVVLNTGTGHFGSIPFSWSTPLALHRSSQAADLTCSRLDLGQGRARIEANIAKDRIKGGLTLTGFDLSILESLDLPPLLGLASLKLDLAGSLSQPEVDLRTDVQGLQPNLADLSQVQPISGECSLSYRNNFLRAELKAASLGVDLNTRLELPLQLALSPFEVQPAGDPRGSAEINVDLGVLNTLIDLPGQRIAGRLQSDLKLTGSIANPRLQGHLVLTQGSYENTGSGTILNDLALECAFANRTIHLKSLTASDGQQGTISGTGTLELLPDKDFSAKTLLSLDQARLVRLDFLEAQTTGEIRFNKDKEGAVLSGKLNIFPIEIRIPEAQPRGLDGLTIVRSDIQEASAKQEPTAKQQPSFLSRLNTDIRIGIPSQCFVRGKGLDSEWQGDLQITNTAEQPEINGNIQLVRGHIDFLTKRFDLKQGVITFINEVPPKPILDIQAETRSRDLTIILSITGPSADPQLSLSSQPTLPRDEILAQLLFGQGLDKINPIQAVKLALAVRTLTSGGNSQGIMGKFRQTMGLDELEIKTEPGQEGGPVVGAGTYLNENIYFKVEQGLGAESSEVSVQIELTPRISLETSAGSVTQGVEVLWEYTY